MKKIFSFSLTAAMLLAMGASVTSCSSDDDDGTFSEKRVEKYVTGYKWYLDNNKRSEFRFYRNRLVTCMSSSGVTSGSLTWAESYFFGTLAVADGKLVTTFTSGAYEGFDWNSILYGSLTINELLTNVKEIRATAPNGDEHELNVRSWRDEIVDYSDASDHDGALVGTWWVMATLNDGSAVRFTMTIGKNGKVNFTSPSLNVDINTTCSTKNGHVAFDIFLTPGTGSRSYIYVREKNMLVLYSEKNAQSAWVWEKEE